MDSGGDPEVFAGCMACGNVYPVRRDGDGWRPVGTDGVCVCGNDEFEVLSGL